MTSISTAKAQVPDEPAIRSVVAEYGATWNRHDIAAMATLFAEDAHWVNIVGWHWPGKAAVVAGHDMIHRSFFQKTDIEIVEVTLRAIAPSVVTAGSCSRSVRSCRLMGSRVPRARIACCSS